MRDDFRQARGIFLGEKVIQNPVAFYLKKLFILRGQRKWVNLVQTSIGRIERLKRNVLEISLEKSTFSYGVHDETMMKFLKQIGMKKEQVEGVKFFLPKSHRKVLSG